VHRDLHALIDGLSKPKPELVFHSERDASFNRGGAQECDQGLVVLDAILAWPAGARGLARRPCRGADMRTGSERDAAGPLATECSLSIATRVARTAHSKRVRIRHSA